ncbi:vimentin-like [Chiloscyllium plagiosum]|uniref:vimentin-like n=1 Tax=Chiloscyllium plagiosum TaxID=36176 RepID=UPI001CB7BC04|nr:vimentin-like [Chiloscyllium plagiosum]
MFSCSRTSSPGSATCTTAAPCQERQNEVAACEVAEKDLQEGMQEGKEQIKELNERFAKYINNTVLNLQRKNKELLAELKKLEKEEFIAVEKAYQKDYQDFQARVDEIQNELVLLKLEKDKLKARLEKECQLKREFDRDFQHLKKSYEDATAGLEKLQCQYKLLEAQLAQLKLVRDQERIYWQQKVDNLQNLDQAESSTLDLEQALRNMRQEYDQMARRNKEELQRYRHKFEENSVPLQKIKKETEIYRNMVTDLRLRDEMHKNHLQEKEREISRIKEYNKSLDKKIEAQTTDFQTLVAVKNGLEQELSGYKSLLNQVEKKARDYNAPVCLTAPPPPPPKPAEDVNKMWC